MLGGRRDMGDIKFEILEHILDLTEPNSRGYTKELNIVSWNGNMKKYDIREWNEDHTRMGKGVTLSYEEMALIVSKMTELGM